MTDVKDVVNMVAESGKNFEDCILCKSPTKQRGVWGQKQTSEDILFMPYVISMHSILTLP